MSTSLSPFDGTGVLNVNKMTSLNGISAANMSAALSALDSTSAIDPGDIEQPRQHLNGNCNLAWLHLVVLAYPLTSIHMVHKNALAVIHLLIPTSECTNVGGGCTVVQNFEYIHTSSGVTTKPEDTAS